MNKISNAEVAAVFDSFPAPVRKQLLRLRQLILDTASENDEIGAIEETLKWGEPSYLAKAGSTIRIGWRVATPDQYAIYFHCQTRLVDTFREIYRHEFTFEGNRAIVFGLNDEIPIEPLKQCIFLSLTYHKRKHLPLLGM